MHPYVSLIFNVESVTHILEIWRPDYCLLFLLKCVPSVAQWLLYMLVSGTLSYELVKSILNDIWPYYMKGIINAKIICPYDKELILKDDSLRCVCMLAVVDSATFSTSAAYLIM